MEKFIKTGKWECTYCHTINPLLNVECSNCHNIKNVMICINCGEQFEIGAVIECPTCKTLFCMACGGEIYLQEHPLGNKYCKVKEHKQFLSSFFESKK